MFPFEGLTELFRAYEGLMMATALCSVRLMAAMSILPATGDAVLNGLLRGGLSVMLGGFVAFGIPQVGDVVAIGAAGLFGLALKELLIGLLIGFAAATVFWIAECVGALIDNQTGFNNVQLSHPLSGEQSTPVSTLLLQLTIVLFYLIGGMLAFVALMMESFKAWPVMSALPSVGGTTELFVVQQTDSLMSTTIKFAAPVLLILVLVDVGLGLVTRAAEKLEPGNLAQPIKGAVAMLLLALFIGVFIAQVRSYLIPTHLVQQLQQFMPRR
jgi:type III secretion protein T